MFKLMLSIVAVVLMTLISSFYCSIIRKKEAEIVMPNRSKQAARNSLPLKLKEHWRYLKELER
ncbi:hypothetical protein [Candidatus Hoaglandella endobia]|uniref:Cell division protein FtsN n=1 Tax=Candidatus Hoaglandella endobia TaxID=1778263 RepID=A0A143WU83_9ENTR|nr:hypothetical protein [Candidatus Hoaglandella endobia]CUX97419.1 Cell division protein FtsN [Candidatus Hoaglandella endobia]